MVVRHGRVSRNRGQSDMTLRERLLFKNWQSKFPRHRLLFVQWCSHSFIIIWISH